MNTLLIDFETTGLDTKQARIIEVGMMLVDENLGVLNQQEFFVSPGTPLTDEIKKITGITDDQVLGGVSPAEAVNCVRLFSETVSNVVAFNSEYDEAMFVQEARRQDRELDTTLYALLGKPWLCAMMDIESNYQFKHWRLAHLALEYGVPVDPSKLHRALGDVELMRQLMVAAKATPKDMREFKLEPWIYLKALVSAPWKDGGESTALAKQLGFSFERAKGDNSGKEFSKTWVKRVKRKFADQEVRSAPFKVVQLS